MNILYIEDEPTDAELVALYINVTPHHLEVASTIEEAWAILPYEPDLILVDVLIGHSRAGYSFARELRMRGYTKPMVAVTALALPQDLEDCRQAGFDDILNKPFTMTQLANIINHYAS